MCQCAQNMVSHQTLPGLEFFRMVFIFSKKDYFDLG